jgi:hypothetical protein
MVVPIKVRLPSSSRHAITWARVTVAIIRINLHSHNYYAMLK